MAGIILKILTTVVVLLSAVIYQIQLPRMISLGLGLGKTFEPLSTFPYTCRRLYHERLQACEDMWLSEATRQLFLACSDPLSRAQWMPHMGHFNVSGRGLNDAILALDLDDLAPGSEAKPRVLAMPEFPGTNGEGRIHVAGFTGSDDEDGSVRLWIPNLKPSVNASTGEFLDPTKFGGNTTVELFRTGRHAEKLEHIRTFAHRQIASPNRIAAVGGDSNAFYFTNDHGTTKAGLTFHLSPLLGTGDVSYCDETSCRQVASGFKFPNGLAKGRDGLIYVPSSLLGQIDVFQPQPDGDLIKVDNIDAGYSLDNLTPDRDGHIYAAAIPDGIKFFAANTDPLNKDTPTTALKVTKNAEDQYEVSKAIEDGLGEVLPGATTVLHDASTGRLFFSSVFAPYIAVCEPK